MCAAADMNVAESSQLAFHRPAPIQQRLSQTTMPGVDRDRDHDRAHTRRRRSKKTAFSMSWFTCFPVVVILIASISFITAFVPLLLRRHRVLLSPSRPHASLWGRSKPTNISNSPHVRETHVHHDPAAHTHRGAHRAERDAKLRNRHHRLAERPHLRLGRQNIVRDHVGRIVEPTSLEERSHEAEEESDSSVGLHRYIGPQRHYAPQERQRQHVPHAAPVHPLQQRQQEPTSQSFTTVHVVGSREVSDGPHGHTGEVEEEVVEEEEDDKDGDLQDIPGANDGKINITRTIEFQGCSGGTTDGMIRGQNVTRVSHTLYKVMKLFGFSSMTDSPAAAHAEWMGEFTHRMTFDQPMFRYVGVDSTEAQLQKVREAVGEDIDADYEVHNVEARFCNSTDVVFHWTELDGSEWDPRNAGYLNHVRKVMQAAKEADHGYIIIGQFPRLKGPMPTYKKGKWVFVEQPTEDPFLFNDYIRGVVPMIGGSQAYVMYFTFYSLRSIPMAQLDL